MMLSLVLFAGMMAVCQGGFLHGGAGVSSYGYHGVHYPSPILHAAPLHHVKPILPLATSYANTYKVHTGNVPVVYSSPHVHHGHHFGGLGGLGGLGGYGGYGGYGGGFGHGYSSIHY